MSKKPRVFGSYRRVGYRDDGVTTYACMDCKNVFNFYDDPHYYNFCPKCGMSWFSMLICREHNVPRWFYDRYQDNHGPLEVPQHPTPYQHPNCWIVESRFRCRVGAGKRSAPFWDEWHPWREEYRLRYFLGSWRDALRYLNMVKRKTAEDCDDDKDWIQHEHRLRIVPWK